jgi:pimeloyl-ACP methyl ester carboxylesterase
MDRLSEGPAAGYREGEDYHTLPKTLIVRGRNDPLILPAAAEFVKQVVPAAHLHYFDGGHFVLDDYANVIAEAIIETFSR